MKFILLIILITNQVMAKEIVLNTTISPPYQYMLEGSLSGVSINALKCIFNTIQKPFSVELSPLERSKKNVATNKADGLFISMQEENIDYYATISAPIALEKWYFYFNNSDLINNKSALKIGVVRGSNKAAWLKQNNYPISMSVNKSTQLIKLLDKGRINTVLFDQKTFGDEHRQFSTSTQPIYSKFVRYTPLGVYLSNTFIAKNPSFLAEFNKAVFTCSNNEVLLSEEETSFLHHISQKIYKSVQVDLVFNEIEKQNNITRFFDNDKIIALDRQWRDEIETLEKPLISKTLSTPLSLYLQKLQKKYNSLFSEIIITDRQGLNVAQSNTTSDYWQGDEIMFKQLFERDDNSAFLDKVRYDESSRKYQLKVSYRLIHPISGQVIGVLIVGIDLEHALALMFDYYPYITP